MATRERSRKSGAQAPDPEPPVGGLTIKARAALLIGVEIILWATFACWEIWGTPASFLNHLPLGTESSATVPFLNAWTVGWNAHQAASGFENYFHAPIFYPAAGAFTFSEMQPTMLLVAPLAWSTTTPVVAYNVYLCLQLALTATLARQLARSLGYSPWLSLFTALLLFHLPFARWQMGVIQLTSIWGPLGVMVAILRFTNGPGVRSATILGAALAACYAACNYYGLFMAMLSPIALVLLWPPGRSRDAAPRDARFWFSLLLSFALAVTLVSPWLSGQLRYLASSADARPGGLVHHFSAAPLDYAISYPNGFGWIDAPPWRAGQGRPLGAGIALSSLALLGVLAHCVLRPPADAPPADTGSESSAKSSVESSARNGTGTMERATVKWEGAGGVSRSRWFWFCTLLAVGAMLASMGPRLTLLGVQPWDWIGSWFPPLRLVRVPYRLAVVYQIAVVLMAMETCHRFGFEQRLWEGVRGMRRLRFSRAGGLVLVVLGLAAVVAETWPLRPAWQDIRTLQSNPSWVHWLREQTPPHAVVACLPFPRDGSTAQYEATSRWMLRSLQFQRPLVNGYSGFFPVRYRQLRVTMQQFPSEDSLQQLRLLGAGYLVIDRSAGGAGLPTASDLDRSPLRQVFQDPEAPVTIWRIDR